MRILCHFSCGAASAVATKLALDKYGADNCEVVNIHIVDEHPDNARFLADCEQWFGKKIKIVTNEKYGGSVDEVIRQSNFIKGPKGAPCTTQLKRKVRAKMQRDDDVHIFGFTAEEQDRADELQDAEPSRMFDHLLIEGGVTKADCLGILERQGIEIPTMYKLGYQNNNCIGCVKGAMGYWNKIRVDFPEVFAKRAAQERAVKFAINKDDKGPVFLDELDPKRGRLLDEPDIECGLVCRNFNY